MAHLTALLLALGYYAVLVLALLGWGRALRRVLHLPTTAGEGPFLDLWLGWAAFLGLLQFVHLAVPLRAVVVLPLLAIGLLFVLRLGPGLPRRWNGGTRRTQILAGVWLVAASWMFSRAMQTPLDFDGGLYHFHTIRWINEARLTPGLGNLHGRLAFNSAFHTFVAALNLPPWFGHGRAMANTFLGLTLLAQILHGLPAARPGSAAAREPARLAPLAHLLALPLVGYLSLTSLGLASPSADLASSYIQVVAFLLLVEGLDAGRIPRPGQETRLATLVLLATTLVTLKLSNLGFAATVAALGAAYAWRSRLPPRNARTIAAIGSALALIWIARGYVLSGYPCYPSTLGGITFDWQVPATQARHDAENIFSWARQPWSSPREVLGNARWLDPWLYRARHNVEGIVAPLGVTLAAALAALVLQRRARRAPSPPAGGSAWLLVPVAGGLLFWWFTAPDPRFAHALPWLLPIAALLRLAEAAAERLDYRPTTAALVALVLLAHAHFALHVVRHPEKLGDLSATGWQPVLPPGFTPRPTLSGLIVNTYRYAPEQLIWDGPRPATPDFNPRLRLRVPQKPEFGFTTR